MLSVKNLTVRYGEKTVLDQVGFELREGEFLAVIGPNGAGKSTLVRALSGILPAVQGQIYWNDQNLEEVSAQERARLIAVVPQLRSLPPSFTAWQVVSLGRTPYLNWFGQISKMDEEMVRRAMEKTRTLSLAGRLLSELSGGEIQRLLLARALVQTTPLLLLDEPTTHLDLQFQVNLLNQLSDLARKPGGWDHTGNGRPLGVLAVLHDLNLVARYADRVLLLVDGKVSALGTMAEVLQPDVLTSAFGIKLEVVHPQTGRAPMIFPVG